MTETPMEQKVTEAEVEAAVKVLTSHATIRESYRDRVRLALQAALSSRAPQAGGEWQREQLSEDAIDALAGRIVDEIRRFPHEDTPSLVASVIGLLRKPCGAVNQSYDAAWAAILAADELKAARAKLSIHELRLIIRAALAPTPADEPKGDGGALEEAAKAIESVTLHRCNQETGHTAPKSADWLNGNDAGVLRGLKYAARTVRVIAEEALSSRAPQAVGEVDRELAKLRQWIQNYPGDPEALRDALLAYIDEGYDVSKEILDPADEPKGTACKEPDFVAMNLRSIASRVERDHPELAGVLRAAAAYMEGLRAESERLAADEPKGDVRKELLALLDGAVRNANFYKPDTPDHEFVQVPLQYLRQVRGAYERLATLSQDEGEPHPLDGMKNNAGIRGAVEQAVKDRASLFPQDEGLRTELMAARHEGDAQYELAEELRRALLEIASDTKWNKIELDGVGAERGLMIVSDMQRIAREALALSTPSQDEGETPPNPADCDCPFFVELLKVTRGVEKQRDEFFCENERLRNAQDEGEAP